MDVVLASRSPRRSDLLLSLGLNFSIEAADVDEDCHVGEDAIPYVERIAQSKAEAVAERLGRPSGVAVLAADTTVDVDGEIFAKPVDDDDARRILTVLSHRTHLVHTSVYCWTSEAIAATTVTTSVTFVRLTDRLLEWYLSRGEHLDKAGAYGMQGAGGALVRRIDGSPSNVIGLPLAETVGVLGECGVML